MESEIKEAKNLLVIGYNAYSQNNIDFAHECFKRSIKMWPTAEGYAFYGWSLSWKQQFHDAIRNCKLGINLDPDFGNNYNDIGAYLIALNQMDEAVEYLELAIRAPNYATRNFPYYNLGLIEKKKGNWLEALKLFKKSLEIDPNYSLCKNAYYQMQGILN